MCEVRGTLIGTNRRVQERARGVFREGEVRLVDSGGGM